MENQEILVSKLLASSRGIKIIKSRYKNQITKFPNSFDWNGYSDLEKKLNEYEKNSNAQIFQILKPEIKMAANKAQMKFPSIPLELNDFLTEGWISLNEAIIKYDCKRSDRGFSKYYLDVVYWRSMDYIRKFLTNKHKAVNLALTRSIVNASFDFDTLDLVESDPWKHNNIMSIIKDFAKNANNLDREILGNYLYGDDLDTIAQKVNCEKRSTQRKLHIVLGNLKRKLA
ncbi:hypothetical protein [Spiroplasma alleghenense]|uniref:Uncharacterized protein n=1 Tax=Spiroplasma alleghenense TaxID=216931 RepID=A0A345Z280_9MOLU|nr:hypothetical protein [Spiroplasma alleghenense]AXK50709.1 hypothetical protein SALLE_v1c00330 [Spiroplasma alleghenense]